jgi:LmbE family N-acetylglucosaminyl deacetylase
MAKKERVLVFSAHTDDFVLGAGGTIAKYTQEGKKVTAVVFSLGEGSHPWLKKKVIKGMREEETFKASEPLGCDVVFFDLQDQNVYEDYKKQGIEKKLLALVHKEKPDKIFTHSSQDSHLSVGLLAGKDDHKAVNKITLEIYEKLKQKPELYVFSVWSPVQFKTQFPTLYVDISKTFRLKMKSLFTFKTQLLNAIYPLIILIFQKAVTSGFKIRKRFAESFYRIK